MSSFGGGTGESEPTKIYVGGINYDTNEETLKAQFEGCGNIEEVIIVRNRDNGQSRGYGFIKFDNEVSVEKAINSMNGVELNQRTIKVSRAQKRSGGGGFRGGGRGGFRGGRGGGYPSYSNNTYGTAAYAGTGGFAAGASYGLSGGYGAAMTYGAGTGGAYSAGYGQGGAGAGYGNTYGNYSNAYEGDSYGGNYSSYQ